MNRLIVVATCLVAVSCSPAAKPAPSPQAGPEAVVSLHDLMEHIVEPAAYSLWDSTAITTDEKGVHAGHPKTEEDWARVRSAALTLSEAPNLIVLSGRHVLPPGGAMEDGGTLDAAGIEALIRERPDSFATHALGLQVVAKKALAAVDAKDLHTLDMIGGDIDAACESCHQEFWYPPAKNATKP